MIRSTGEWGSVAIEERSEVILVRDCYLFRAVLSTAGLGIERMEVKHIVTELAAKPEGTFLDLLPFNGNNISACNITGTSPVWEMHPDTDEFFFILEGEFEITLWQEDQPEHFVAPAGSSFVVPRGVWHKPAAPRGSKFIYLTPGTTLHSEDPHEATASV